MKKSFVISAIALGILAGMLWIGIPRSNASHPVPFYAADAADPNVLIIVDSSGSMTFDTYGNRAGTGDGGGDATWGDGSDPSTNPRDYRGMDTGTPNPPSTTLDGLRNDSRLFIAKNALTALIQGTDGIRFALSRYYQSETGALFPVYWWYRQAPYGAANRVPLYYDGSQGANWNCNATNVASPGGDTGRLLVNFPATPDPSDTNKSAILQWMNHTEDYAAGNRELRGDGSTPIDLTLQWANNYLARVRSADTATCRRNFVILLTDGNETCGGTPPNAATTLHDNGFDVFVIGFAIPGGGQASINAIARAGGTDANQDGDDNPNTGDAAYFANSPQQLQDALNDIIAHIKRGAFTRSAPTLSTDGQNVYLGYFNLPGWKGHLVEYSVSNLAVGFNQFPTENWDAGTLVPAVGADNAALTYTTPSTGLMRVQWGSRVLYAPATNQTALLNAVNPTPTVSIPCASIGLSSPTASQSAENILKFTMNPGFCNSAYKGARYANWRLGDIYHSEAIVVGPPRGVSNDTTYQDFKAANATRKKVVYVGANDGSLHAFNAAGEEIWVWVPNNLLGKLRDQRLGHQFYVDSSPTASDVYINGAWKTVLISGERQGGNYYFAIDITDPDNPKPLWEFTHARLGETWSKPAIGVVATSSTQAKWAAFLGGGRPSTAVGCNPTSSGCATTLLVIDIENGQLIPSAGQLNNLDVGDLSGSPENGLVAPPALSRGSTGLVETVYLGDLEGRLWKFDVSTKGVNSWSTCLLYDPENATDDNPLVDDRRPIYHRTSVFTLSNGLFVAFGTGDETQPASSYRERVYIVRDPGKGECPSPVGSLAAYWYTGKGGVTPECSTNLGVSCPQLAVGEKILGRPIVYAGFLIFTTYTSTNPCETGTSKLYVVDLNEPGIMVMTIYDLGGGVASKPVATAEGKVYVASSNPQEFEKPVFHVLDLGVPGARLKSWREIF
jgi:hypothetical protein